MRKIPFLALALAAACGQSLKDQTRDALPGASQLKMGSPDASSAAAMRPAADTVAQNSTVGQISEWKKNTVGVALIFNGATAWTLGLVELITDFEPTSCDDKAQSCTWGPGSNALDANTFKLVVTKNGEVFHWELSAEPKSKPGSGFLVIISGDATPGAQRHHGSGTLVIDFEKARLLDNPKDDHGVLSITYTNVGPAHIDAQFLGANDDKNPGYLQNIAYTYANDRVGGGDLDLGVHKLFDDSRFSLHSRWKNDGQGRADVEALGVSSGTAYDAHLSECWGAAPFTVTYFTSDRSDVFGPDSGVESSCAIAPAAFSQKQVQ